MGNIHTNFRIVVGSEIGLKGIRRAGGEYKGIFDFICKVYFFKKIWSKYVQMLTSLILAVRHEV